MSPVLPTILLLSGAGLGLAMLAAAEGAPAATEPSYFDPVLSGGLCAPNTTDRRSGARATTITMASAAIKKTAK